MHSEDLTVTSLTTEPDNLTALHQLSGLTTTHDSRRTAGGFLVRADRLPNCVPYPVIKGTHRSGFGNKELPLDVVRMLFNTGSA